jgi:hypothetical protein
VPTAGKEIPVKGILIDKGARLYKPLGCPVWHLDLSLPGRRRQRTSLHTTTKDHAIVLARQLVQEALSNRWGVSLPRDVGYAEFFEEYKEYMKLHNAEGTRGLNWPVLERFGKFVAEHRRLSRTLRLSDVSREDVEAFKPSAGAASRSGQANLFSLASFIFILFAFAARIRG